MSRHRRQTCSRGGVSSGIENIIIKSDTEGHIWIYACHTKVHIKRFSKTAKILGGPKLCDSRFAKRYPSLAAQCHSRLRPTATRNQRWIQRIAIVCSQIINRCSRGCDLLCCNNLNTDKKGNNPTHTLLLNARYRAEQDPNDSQSAALQPTCYRLTIYGFGILHLQTAPLPMRSVKLRFHRAIAQNRSMKPNAYGFS